MIRKAKIGSFFILFKKLQEICQFQSFSVGHKVDYGKQQTLSVLCCLKIKYKIPYKIQN